MLINPYSLEPPPIPWSPNDLASKWAWSEADIYAQVDASAITTNWLDQSGNGRNGVLGGSGGTYRTNQINGQPVVRNAATRWFSLPTMAGLTAASLYMVIRVVSANNGGWKFDASGLFSHYPFSGLIYDASFRSSRVDNLSTQVTLTNWHLVHIWSAAGDWGMKQNNLTVHTTTSNTVQMPTAPRLLYNNSIVMDAELAAWYVFNAKLASQDDTDLRAYINGKYGLTV